jgi:hypothetical protein
MACLTIPQKQELDQKDGPIRISSKIMARDPDAQKTLPIPVRFLSPVNDRAGVRQGGGHVIFCTLLQDA